MNKYLDIYYLQTPCWGYNSKNKHDASPHRIYNLRERKISNKFGDVQRKRTSFRQAVRNCVLHQEHSQRTRRAEAKLFFRLVDMLISKGSLQVIIAIPAVKLRIMWWAAIRIRDSSESKAKSFLTICSQVVMAILIDRSTTGWTSSWTARSIAWRTHCFNCGWAWNKGI